MGGLSFTERVYRLALRTLPAELHARIADEVFALFRARRAAATTASARLLLFGTELLGLLRTAFAARYPDRWTARTQRDLTHHDAHHRSPRTWSDQMEQTLGDLRYALRSFLRRPFTIGIAVVSLALGIGASVAMFSVVHTVLMRPLPFHDPARLVAVYPTDPELRGHPTMGALADRGDLSWAEFWDIHDHATLFAGLAAFQSTQLTLGGDSPQVLDVGLVTPGMFQTLGVKPFVGSLFVPSDTIGQDTHVVVLGYELWRSRFGAEAGIVGRSIMLRERPYLVVGVMPPQADIATGRADLWIPRVRQASDEQNRGAHSEISAIGRLKPGVSPLQAQAEVASILHAVTPPNHFSKHGAAIYPLQLDRTHTVRPALLLLLVASGLLLLVGCANVAAILLGVGLERRQEMRIRRALGAGSRRLIRQLLTESLLLAALGGVLGLGAASVAMRLLLLFAPSNIPRIGEATLDPQVLVFAVGVSLLSGLLFGVLPAFAVRRSGSATSLASSRGNIGGVGVGQQSLVVAELALATVLLIGAALLLRTLLALNAVNTGLQVDNLVHVEMMTPSARFSALGPDSVDRVYDRYIQTFIDAIATLPDVRDVAATSNVPLSGQRGNNTIHPVDWHPANDEQVIAERRFVSVNYFTTTGMPLVAGRNFGPEDDRLDAPKTMVISAGLANHIWPHESALGKHIGFWGFDAVVVGVVPDVRDQSLDAPTTLAYYVPYHQYGPYDGSLVIRTRGDPLAAIPSIRERIRSVDAAVAISTLEPFPRLVEQQTAGQRYRARLMLIFAALSGVFAGLGVFGVTARSVARRTREIGIRMALGAGAAHVLRLVVRQAIAMALLGVGLGVLGALVARRVLAGMLYGVSATDPLSLIVTVVLVGAVALAATIVPARRAAGVSPMEALRND